MVHHGRQQWLRGASWPSLRFSAEIDKLLTRAHTQAQSELDEQLCRQRQKASGRFCFCLAQVLDLSIRIPNRDRRPRICQGQNDLALIFAREYEIQ